MKEKHTVPEKINIAVTVAMLGVLFLFLCTVIISLGKKVLLKLDGDSEENTVAVIDWAEEYPFAATEQSVQVEESVFDKVRNRLGVYENYISSNLYKKSEFVYAANVLEEGIGWEADYVGNYNPVFRLEDNYLVKLGGKVDDVTPDVNSTVALRDYCDKLGVDFVYVTLPHKVSKFSDTEYDGKYSFFNGNADRLMDGLKQNHVNTLDIRDNLKQKSAEYHKCFFETDHHWKMETALMSAGYIAGYLNETFGYDIDLGVFSEEKYKKEVYEEQFLGSLGKKWTTAKVKPDDFTLMYPEFETSLSLEITTEAVSREGDFSIVYNMDNMVKDYQGINTYVTYLWGDVASVKLRNAMEAEDKKILIIKDSYVNAMAPFLALGVSEVDMLDLRHFTGSVKTYIEKEKPDVVIVAYNAESVTAWKDNWIYDFE